MPITIRSFLPVRNIDSILAAIAGFLIIHYFTRHSGIGVSPDSVDYISTAANLHDHGSLVNYNGTPLVNFPAGYPLFLSAIMFITGLDGVHFGPLLNGLLFAALIFSCGWLMEGFSFRPKWMKWALLSVIVLSPCLLEIYSMIWSETLFILLSVGFIYACRRYFLSGSVAGLLVMALIAGLACILRYAGICLIATGGLLLLCDTGMKPLKRVGRILLFGFVSYLPLSVNLWMNVGLSGTLTGNREKGVESFGTILRDFGGVFGDWLGFSASHLVAAGIAIFFILAFILVFIKRVARRENVFAYENIATAYFIVYALFILLTATISRFQQLDSRLLSPLFIPWLWGSVAWVPAGMTGLGPKGRAMAILILGAFLLAFQWGQIRAYRENWEGIRDAGIPGYTEDDWQRSETMEFVRNHKDSLSSWGGLCTNADDAIWFLTGIHATLLPHKDFTKDVQVLLGRDHFAVAWFNDGINPDLVSIGTISRYRTLARVQTFSDGAVYFFSSQKNDLFLGHAITRSSRRSRYRDLAVHLFAE